MNRIREFIETIIIEPIRRYLVFWLLLIGIILVCVSTFFPDYINNIIGFLPHGSVREALLSLGSAILGAGIFAAVVKSTLFVKIFQNHIHDVLHDPYRIFGIDNLKEKWTDITKKMLEAILPASHSEVSKRIKDQFFNTDLQYHFEDYETKYNISFEKNDIKNAKITHTINTKLVISKNHPEPVFNQEISVNGDCKLISLIINGENIETNGILKQQKNRNR